jgi:hypothetical protein
LKVTVPHAGEGFCEESSVVAVGEPTASAGDAASAPNPINTDPSSATRVARLLAFTVILSVRLAALTDTGARRWTGLSGFGLLVSH